MSTRIIRIGQKCPQLDTFVGSLEVVEEQMHVRTTRPLRYQGEFPRNQEQQHHGIEFFLLDNAFMPDAMCTRFNFYSAKDGRTVWELLGALLKNLNPETIRLYLDEILERHAIRPGYRNGRLQGTDGQDVFIFRLPGKNVFSHGALYRLERLKTVPAVWDMSHVRAALANGQAEQLKARGGLSAIELLEEIVMADADVLFRSAWRTRLERAGSQVAIEREGKAHSTFRLVL
jgi:hypothetical protein